MFKCSLRLKRLLEKCLITLMLYEENEIFVKSYQNFIDSMKHD